MRRSWGACSERRSWFLPSCEDIQHSSHSVATVTPLECSKLRGRVDRARHRHPPVFRTAGIRLGVGPGARAYRTLLVNADEVDREGPHSTLTPPVGWERRGRSNPRIRRGVETGDQARTTLGDRGGIGTTEGGSVAGMTLVAIATGSDYYSIHEGRPRESVASMLLLG